MTKKKHQKLGQKIIRKNNSQKVSLIHITDNELMD